MDRVGNVTHVFSALEEALEHKRVDLSEVSAHSATEATALASAVAARRQVMASRVFNSTERIMTLIESIRAKNSTFGHIAVEALNDVINFDIVGSVAAGRLEAAKKAQEVAEAAEVEWEYMKNRTVNLTVHFTAQVEESRRRMQERYQELAVFRHLNNQLWELQRLTLGNSSVDLRKRAKEEISSLIARLKMQNTSMAVNAAEALQDAMRVGGEVSVIPMVVFVISAMLCLGASAACHLYYAFSLRYNLFMSKLDYAGITALIAGSFFPVIFYGLHCNPIAKRVYMTCILVLSLMTLRVMLSDQYLSPEYNLTRTLLFVALGFFGVIPLGQHYLMYGMTDMLVNLLLMGTLYLIGAVFYVLQIPERWYPGTFDYVGNSHLIWHLLVLSAALVHWKGSWAAYSQVLDLEEMDGAMCA